MELATSDPHSQKEHTPRLTKSPSLGLIKLVLTELQRFKNVKINKRNVWPYFENFHIFKWLYLAYY